MIDTIFEHSASHRTGASILVLMRGLAGSGKSTEAARLAAMNEGVVVSADDFFIGPDGIYRHDRSRVREAHHDAQLRIEAAFADGAAYVVADNTHITHRDMEEYLRLPLGVEQRSNWSSRRPRGPGIPTNARAGTSMQCHTTSSSACATASSR